MRCPRAFISVVMTMVGGGLPVAGAEVLFVNNGNSVYALDSSGTSILFSGEGGCAMAYGDFGSGPRVYVGDASTHVLDTAGNSTLFSSAGGCAMAFGGFSSASSLYVNNGNEVRALDADGGAMLFSGQGGNSMVFGDFGSGPRLYVNNGNDIYELDSTGASTHFSGQGGNSMVFGDFGSGPLLYVNNGNDIYELDSTGASTHFSGQGGNSMVFGDFGSGLRLYVNNGNDIYELDSTGTSTHFSGQGGSSMVFGTEGAGAVGEIVVTRAGTQDLLLSWEVGCGPTAIDYGIYEGTLGTYYSHTALRCGTGSATSVTITTSPGSRYYLVVPLSTTAEGSYGTDSAGRERPKGTVACKVLQIPACTQP